MSAQTTASKVLRERALDRRQGAELHRDEAVRSEAYAIAERETASKLLREAAELIQAADVLERMEERAGPPRPREPERDQLT